MIKGAVACCLLVMSGSLLAGDASEILENFFKGLKTFSSDFEQVIENSQLSMVEVSSGQLWISRPGKFRWDYTKPFIQEIVSDGNKIWIYDADLEQVTVRAVNSTLGNTPAVLLSDDKPLSETFTMQSLGETAGLSWVALSPKDSEAGFTSIKLAFNGKDLSEMLLLDNLGQITQLRFSSIKRNPSVQASRFQFTAPPGADVFDTSSSE